MTPFTVLVVDDDPDMRLYLRSCLQSLSVGVARVLEAGDGLEALRLVGTGEVHLVISDIVVPGLDGRSLCRVIRESRDLEDVSVLLISGEDGAGVGGSDADGFLAKPFNCRQLTAALQGLLPQL